jgi:hypothetical protein
LYSGLDSGKQRLNLALLAFLLAQGSFCFAQTTLLDRGYGQMYNLQFQEAHQSFQTWETQHPDDPMGPVSNAAAYLFSEFDRLHILESEFFAHNDNFRTREKLNPDPKLRASFEQELNRTQQLANRAIARSPKDETAIFANILRLGLHADYLALIDKKYVASLNEMKQGRLMAQRLVASDPNYFDAYLAIGIENYLLSQKIAPVRWILRMNGAETDKDQGVKTLSKTAEKGRYLLPFARLMLAVAALRDNNRMRAIDILQGLARDFPRNRLYAEEVTKLAAQRTK